jgi:uncharacterized repeat protein (TIGR01451 family)
MNCRLCSASNARRRRMGIVAALSAVVLLATPPLSASAATRAVAQTATTESADIATTVQGQSTRITSGYITYSITVTNHGPNYAQAVVMSDNWWSGITGFYSVTGSAPSGLSCTAPAVGSVGTVTCTTASLAPGASMAIRLTIHVRILFHNQLLIDTATASSQTFDPNTANNTATWVIEG